MENKTTYQVTAPSGRVWTLRPLPKHFFIYYGQLPSVMTAEVLKQIRTGNTEAVEKEIEKNLTADEIMQTAMFIRDAVDYACVNPKITLAPKNENEISPFKITPEDYDFISQIVMKGGEAGGLKTFRVEQTQTSVDSADGAEIREAAEPTA